MSNPLSEPKQDRTVKDVLWEVCPLECDSVGHALVDDIVKGQKNFASFDGGAHMELQSIIGILPPVVSLLSLIFQSVQEYRKHKMSGSETKTESERIIIINLVEHNDEVSPDIKARILDVLVSQPRSGADQ